MQYVNWPVVIIITIAALALLMFLARRNRRDKKEIYPPDKLGDPVNDAKTEQAKREDKL